MSPNIGSCEDNKKGGVWGLVSLVSQIRRPSAGPECQPTSPTASHPTLGLAPTQEKPGWRKFIHTLFVPDSFA